MKLVVTIDAEEDSWACYSSTDNPVKNIERINKLQTLFDQFGVKPTYLVTYPVATNPRSVETLKRILDVGKCEIGIHCHPWNTPPFEEEINEKNSMLCNLPEELQYLKLAHLHEAICQNFEIEPVSSRAGRWGFGQGAARALCRLGYLVDTSVTPFVSWKMYQGPDFSDFYPDAFRFNAEGLFQRDEKGPLLEVPATIGFLQTSLPWSHKLMRIAESGLGRKLHLARIMDCLRMVNKVWLSPELADVNSMIKLAKRMNKNNCLCLNMTFHSTSLWHGLGPFVRTMEDEKRFFRKIREFIEFASASGWESQTLAQFEAELCGGGFQQNGKLYEQKSSDPLLLFPTGT